MPRTGGRVAMIDGIVITAALMSPALDAALGWASHAVALAAQAAIAVPRF